MNKEEKRFEEETQGMSLEDKLSWVKHMLFLIETDDYIQDKKEWYNYIDIRNKLQKELEDNK